MFSRILPYLYSWLGLVWVVDDLQVLAHLITIRCEQCTWCCAVSLSTGSLLNPHGRIPNCQASFLATSLLLTFLGELFLWSHVKYDQKVPAWADECALKSVFRKLYEILHYLSNMPLAGLPIPRHFVRLKEDECLLEDLTFSEIKASAQWAWVGSRILLFLWGEICSGWKLCWEHSQASDFTLLNLPERPGA